MESLPNPSSPLSVRAVTLRFFAVGVGIRFSWSELSVDETVAVCVFTSSELLATVMLSDSCPTSSTALMEAGVPGRTVQPAT